MYYSNPVPYNRFYETFDTPQEINNPTTFHQFPGQHTLPLPIEPKEFSRMEYPEAQLSYNYGIPAYVPANSAVGGHLNSPPYNAPAELTSGATSATSSGLTHNTPTYNDSFSMQGFNNNTMFNTVPEALSQLQHHPVVDRPNFIENGYSAHADYGNYYRRQSYQAPYSRPVRTTLKSEDDKLTPGIISPPLSSRMGNREYQAPEEQAMAVQTPSQYRSDKFPPTNRDYTDGTAPFRKLKVVRGMSAGGCASRPPKPQLPSSTWLPVQLEIADGLFEDICLPEWNYNESMDMRRIIRIERFQEGPTIVAKFLIVGSAIDFPEAQPPLRAGVDVVEVSCLQCPTNNYNSSMSYIEDPDDQGKSISGNRYYITSVEVVEIVETLIGIQDNEPMIRRKERGRIRSNLVPFWLKKPISSRMCDTEPQDVRSELARRIMGYEKRKPRGFDKEVRILRWDKLIPALKRAVQSYYVEIPRGELDMYK